MSKGSNGDGVRNMGRGQPVGGEAHLVNCAAVLATRDQFIVRLGQQLYDAEGRKAGEGILANLAFTPAGLAETLEVLERNLCAWEVKHGPARSRIHRVAPVPEGA